MTEVSGSQPLAYGNTLICILLQLDDRGPDLRCFYWRARARLFKVIVCGIAQRCGRRRLLARFIIFVHYLYLLTLLWHLKLHHGGLLLAAARLRTHRLLYSSSRLVGPLRLGVAVSHLLHLDVGHD